MTAKLINEATKGLQFREPPIFERGSSGRSGASLARLDVPQVDLAKELGGLGRKVPAGLPEVSEPEAIRHFVRLSQWNFSIDTQFYPLGSCTMKHNPKVNEWAARLEGFANLHPLTPDHLAQGALELMVRLSAILAEIVGLDGVNLQPAAGAQGELTGLMMIRAYHHKQGRSPRKVFIPDSAHGTNPASCALNGFEAVPFASGSRGVVEPATLIAAIEAAGGEVAGLMMTNPNTLGLYESAMPQICQLIHERGGLVYGDGANMNAVLDETDSGLDVDALKIVSEGVNRAHDATHLGILLITHYTRILRYIHPDFVHVFVDGRVAEEGGPELADRLENEGYDRFLVGQA